jgi:hypothetical protein
MKFKFGKRQKKCFTQLSSFLAPIDRQIKRLSSSKFFVGIVLICLNVASKFTTVKLSKTTENFLRTGFAWQILVFCMSYMGTRDIYTSLILTAIFILITQYLCNEESRLCLLPSYFRERYQNQESQTSASTSGSTSPSKAEIDGAIEVLKKVSETVDTPKESKSLNVGNWLRPPNPFVNFWKS